MRGGSLPPTLKQRIRAEAHGKTPGVRRSTTAAAMGAAPGTTARVLTPSAVAPPPGPPCPPCPARRTRRPRHPRDAGARRVAPYGQAGRSRTAGRSKVPKRQKRSSSSSSGSGSSSSGSSRSTSRHWQVRGSRNVGRRWSPVGRDRGSRCAVPRQRGTDGSPRRAPGSVQGAWRLALQGRRPGRRWGSRTARPFSACPGAAVWRNASSLARRGVQPVSGC
ncbi:DUF6344 domain-containing protein [Streptomyces erythrochromogenes]|uniref:DUF6344 domain-containing protein n=1 Tax=Streptomyces erythrochromogenes TaxID=285574 RepID=UPI003678A95F